MQSVLEKAYQNYHVQFKRDRDPIGLVHSYRSKKDQEVVAFISALLAYGNVQTIRQSLHSVLLVLGKSPYQRILEQSHWPELKGFRHRFTSGNQLNALLYALHEILNEQGGLETYFITQPGSTLKDRLSAFVKSISAKSEQAPERLGAADQRSFRYLLSDPERGSACKRLNLFLRWVVRKRDGIDLGLWSALNPKELILPVDTHILKTLQKLRWTRSKTATWQVAIEATEKLKRFDPLDPIRYDFSLCHLSMEGKSLENL